MADSIPDSSRSLRSAYLVLIALTVAALWPVATFDFTLWDDPGTIYNNPNLNPPTLDGLAHHWTHAWGELYVPLTYTVWWLVAHVARVSNDPGAAAFNPWIFHAMNLLTHLGAACVALRLLTRLGLSQAAAFFGAAIFAIHPVQVESVAWISGTKDVLFGFFTLVAVDQYIAFVQGGGRRQYACCISFLIAALLSKPTAVAVPLIAFAVDVLALRSSVRVAVRRAAPLALLALPCVVWSKIAQPASLIAPQPLWWRPFVAGDALAFYAVKIGAPLRLCIDYGRTPQQVIHSGIAFRTAPVALAMLGAAVVFCFSRSSRALAMAGVWIFVAALSPVLGLLPFEFQAKSTVADHYLYLPMLGVGLLIAATVDRFAQRARRVVIGAAACCTLALAARSWAQTWTWADSPSLFNHAIAVNERSTIGPFNLVFHWLRQQRPDLAEPYARRMIELTPDDVWAHVHLATALAEQHRYAEAEPIFRAAAQRWPDSPEAQGGLGSVLLDLNRPGEALAAYDAAIALQPGNVPLLALRTRALEMLNGSATTHATTKP